MFIDKSVIYILLKFIKQFYLTKINILNYIIYMHENK